MEASSPPGPRGSAPAGPARKAMEVTLPGVRLHVTEAGAGAPLVLLHGWPQHGGMWEPLIDELAAEHRVLVPDLRGFGRSEAPRSGYDKHTLAADVLALLDHQELEEATIIGHDWGGWIAWLLALEHPERVTRFASLDTPPPWSTTVSAARLPLQLLYGSYQLVLASPLLGERLIRSRRFVRRFIETATGPHAQLDEQRLEDYARLTAQPASARAAVALYRTFLLSELPAVARGTYTATELTVPGLVIMGAESAIRKMSGLPLQQANLRVEEIAGVGHFVVDEAPDRVLALLRPFLAERPPG